MMALKAAAFLVGTLLLVFGFIAVAVWIRELLKRRNARILDARQDRADRTKGLALVEGDRTADDCPSVALADHGGGYACELDREHPLPHRNGVWVWDYEDDIQIDLGAVGDLAAAVNRTADDLADAADAVAEPDKVAPEPVCGKQYHRAPTLVYTCDRLLHLDRLHADHSCGTVEWYADDDIWLDNGRVVTHDPTPTLHEESLPVAEVDTLAARYIDRTPVAYGFGLVHAGCLAARRDHATDHVCVDCGLTMARAS